MAQDSGPQDSGTQASSSKAKVRLAQFPAVTPKPPKPPRPSAPGDKTMVLLGTFS